MRHIITIAISLICFIGAKAQLPTGLPYPYTRGFGRYGYSMNDSATIVGLRDTSWSARYVGSMVFYRTATDTSLFIWNGVRWMGVAGTATPINPNDFIKNQFAAKETKRSWYDTNKIVSMYGDTVRLGHFWFARKGNMEFDSAAASSGITMFNRNFPTASYTQIHWYDTTTFEITATGIPSSNGKTLSLSASTAQILAYNINLTSSNRSTVANLYGTNPSTFVSTIQYEGFTNTGGVITFNQRPEVTGGGTVFYDGGAITITAQGASTGGTNKNGGDLTLSGGLSTGSGSSNIVFKTATAGGSATTDRTPTTKFTIKGSGVINVANMPTSSAGLSSGDLWSDSGTIKIIP